MANISGIVKSIQNTMWNDTGLNGDAQRIEQLGWMLFFKIFSDKDKELEILQPDYTSPIPDEFHWDEWAGDDEGITGDELLEFVDHKLFPALKNIDISSGNKRAYIVHEVFNGNHNYMKSGTILRQVINKLNEIDFNNSKDKHMFGDVYESFLKELQSAGKSGEFYTPRAVVQFLTDMIKPQLGEKILDTSCGTGGFLTATVEHLKKQSNNIEDMKNLQENVIGWEYKPLPYLLATTNLILHDVEVPNIRFDDSLSRSLVEYTDKDRVDLILANPPFGGVVSNNNEENFPQTYRTKESADLFLILMIHMLKEGGRAAVVLPDASLTGDGIKERIRKKLLIDCDVHTIVRMPKSTFKPYADVGTNLIFFTKGSPTNDIWYYEHKLPKGQKSYSKTKPIEYEEFDAIKDWWNNRKENSLSWKVNVKNLNNWDLEIENPYRSNLKQQDSKAAYKKYKYLNRNIASLVNEIFDNFPGKINPTLKEILNSDPSLFKDLKIIKELRNTIQHEAISGSLSEQWRKENSGDFSIRKFLTRIGKEKSELIQKKIIKNRESTNIPHNSYPFEIPKEWRWVRFSDIVSFSLGKTPSSKQLSYWKDGKYDWLSISDMRNYSFVEKTSKKITEEAFQDVFKGKGISPPGTLLMSFKLTIGRVSINQIPLFHNEAIISIYPFSGIEKMYLFYILPYVTQLFSSKKVLMGQTFNSSSLSNMLIPVMSTEEQNVITKKIEKLFAICDQLEECITSSKANAEQLMQSALKDAFLR